MPPSFGGAAREVRPSLGYPAQPAPVGDLAGRRVAPRVLVVVIVALALVAFSLVALVLVRSMEAPGRGVQVSATTFPDAALRAVVKTYDGDDDGALSAEEVASITSLDCSNRSISSLQGISTLTALAELDASGNDLTEADLSSNASLTDVDLSNNELTSVNLANLTSLVSLDVSGNALTSLDLSACASLQSLSCSTNQLARLDLSKNAQVSSVNSDEGLALIIPIAAGFFPDEGLRSTLAALDTDGDGGLSDRERSAVTSLVVSDPATSDLTGLSWLPNLTALDISGTAVTRLDGSVLPGLLNSLTARDAAVSEVDLTGLEWLYALDLANTPLTALDLAATPRLTSVDVSGTQLSALDVTPCASTLSTLYVAEEGVSVTGALTRTASSFPDAALRTAVFSGQNNPNGDDLLTGTEIAAITALDLTGSGVSDLTGLDALGSLRTLRCDGLSLAGAGFSAAGLGQLRELSLAGCGLTWVDLGAAANLTALDVSNNDLDALVVSASPNLAQLNATGNARLTQVDATGCTQLVPGESALVDEGCTVIQ